ncbi:MAG: response regulator [Nitrospirae bacterium]|nr:response regulator [Nitrospirota bacterium]
MPYKILCIDDIPGEIIGNVSLEDTLKSIFKKNYDVLFEKDPLRAYELIKNDPSIKLVFLDIDFNGDPLGPQIADVLKSINPDLKIIVLTSINRHGEKIRFGKKSNVRKYVIKKELQDDKFKMRVVNLSTALIEDPENKNWMISIDDENETITMENIFTGYKKTVNMPTKARQKSSALLYSCSIRPNEGIKSIEMRGFVDDPSIGADKYVNEIVYDTNAVVREATEWMTWGILDSLGCGTSEVRLIIGKVGSGPNNIIADKKEKEDYAELRRQYDALDKRVLYIETILKAKGILE